MRYATSRTLVAARNAAIGAGLTWGLCRALGLFLPGLAEAFDWSVVATVLAASGLASVHIEAQRVAARVAALADAVSRERGDAA